MREVRTEVSFGVSLVWCGKDDKSKGIWRIGDKLILDFTLGCSGKNYAALAEGD